MNVKRLIAPLVLAAAVAMAGTVYAADGQEMKGKKGEGKPRMEKMEGKRFQEMVKDLQLTPEQQVKVKEHKQNQQKKARELNAQIRANQEQVRAELAKPELDKARIDQLTQERKTLESTRVDQQLAAVLEMRSILTPEQYQKLENKMGKKHQAMKKDGKQMKDGKGMKQGDKGPGMMQGGQGPCGDNGDCGPCD